MPCYTISQRAQVIENVPDINLLAEGLKEMGLSVQVYGTQLAFQGFASGSYSNGKLTSENGLDLELLQKYTAIANMKKQVALKNEQLAKNKKKLWRVKKVSEFAYQVIKPKG